MTSENAEASIMPDVASMESMFNNLEIDSTPLEITKQLRNELTKELDKHLLKGQDIKLEKEIKTSLTSEYKPDGREKKITVNIMTITNPLVKEAKYHEKYMEKIPDETKILFVGMNPSPDSLTGIPFYADEPMKIVLGQSAVTELATKYSEKRNSKSGELFWKLIVKQFKSPDGREDESYSYEMFSRHCFVINYCPLIFMNNSNENVALDGFNTSTEPALRSLMAISDKNFRELIKSINPKLIIAIGRYAENRVKANTNIRCYYIIHPSESTGIAPNAWLDKVSNFLDNNFHWNQQMGKIETEENRRKKNDRPQ